MARWSGWPAQALARVVLLMTVAAGCAAVLVACGGGSSTPARTSGAPVAPSESSFTDSPPAAVISDRGGPSWKGELGRTVQIDWYDQTTGEPVSEQVAILAVRRFPNPYDDEGPDEFGDAYGPYEWKYGIRVRLTSLDERAARYPTAYQFLQLSEATSVKVVYERLRSIRFPDAQLAMS